MPKKNVETVTTRTKSPATKPAAPKRHSKAAATPVIVNAPEPVHITHEQISLLAYSYWVNRGYHGGSPESDWRQAEQELTAKA